MGATVSGMLFPTRVHFEELRFPFAQGLVGSVRRKCSELQVPIESLRVSRREFFEYFVDSAGIAVSGKLRQLPLEVFRAFDPQRSGSVPLAPIVFLCVLFSSPPDTEKTVPDSARASGVFALACGDAGKLSLHHMHSLWRVAVRAALSVGLVKRPPEPGELATCAKSLVQAVRREAGAQTASACAAAFTETVSRPEWQHEWLTRFRMGLAQYSTKTAAGQPPKFDVGFASGATLKYEAAIGSRSAASKLLHPDPSAWRSRANTKSAAPSRKSQQRSAHAAFKQWKQRQRAKLLTSRRYLSHLVVQTGLQLRQVQVLCSKFVEASNRRGMLSFPAFKDVMDELFPAFGSTGALRQLFDAFDVDDSGMVDMREFVVGVGKLVTGDLQTKLRIVFDLFAGTGTGVLSLDDLLKFVQHGSEEVMELYHGARQIVSSMSPDKRNSVSLADFVRCCAAEPVLFSCLSHGRAPRVFHALQRVHEACARQPASGGPWALELASVLRVWQAHVAHQQLIQSNPGLNLEVMRQQAHARMARAQRGDAAAWAEKRLQEANMRQLLERTRSSVVLDNEAYVYAALDECEFLGLMCGVFHMPVSGVSCSRHLYAELCAESGKEDLPLSRALYEMASCLARTPADIATTIFHFADTNQDGRLSQSEVARLLLQQQAKLDASLSAAATLLAHMDRDADGAVTWREFSTTISEHPELLHSFAVLLGSQAEPGGPVGAAQAQPADECAPHEHCEPKQPSDAEVGDHALASPAGARVSITPARASGAFAGFSLFGEGVGERPHTAPGMVGEAADFALRRAEYARNAAWTAHQLKSGRRRAQALSQACRKNALPLIGAIATTQVETKRLADTAGREKAARERITSVLPEHCSAWVAEHRGVSGRARQQAPRRARVRRRSSQTRRSAAKHRAPPPT